MTGHEAAEAVQSSEPVEPEILEKEPSPDPVPAEEVVHQIETWVDPGC